MTAPRRFDAVVLDIEGTTAPIAFVHEVLFPYAAAHLDQFLATHAEVPEVAAAVALLARERGDEREPDAPDGEVADYARWLMARDRKSTGLKALQGMIWRAGYHAGDLTAELYPDVVPALARWHADGVTLASYSSGSIAAQQLLYRHAPARDLTPLFTAWFDTTTGPKRESDSYQRIAATLAIAPARTAFVSDVVEELVAARAVGMHGVLSVRPGNVPVADPAGFPIVTALDQLAV